MTIITGPEFLARQEEIKEKLEATIEPIVNRAIEKALEENERYVRIELPIKSADHRKACEIILERNGWKVQFIGSGPKYSSYDLTPKRDESTASSQFDR